VDRQDLALLLSIVAIACSLRARPRRVRERPYGDPPLPAWTGPYLGAFDRFMRGDPDAPFLMRDVARQNLPHHAGRARCP
jgi:hypothetical protein